MSKMSELDASIRERYERGEHAVDIAYALEIPVDMVQAVIKQIEQEKDIDQ